MKVTYEEIASSLRTMGIEAARERLNFFRNEGAISSMEYLELLHLVNGGSVEVVRKFTFGRKDE